MSVDLLLAIETASLWGSVALARDGAVIAARDLSADRRHTTELIPTIRDLLADQGCRLMDVGVLAYSTGPGSFTGLRVAATVARMAQSAVGCEVVAVPTLEVIARNALGHPNRPQRVIAILDAKRGQVFGAAFERTAADDLRTLAPAEIREPEAWLAGVQRPFAILGEGVKYHEQACQASGGDVLAAEYWRPRAAHTAAVGQRLAAERRFCKPHEIIPNYLRPPACEEVYEERRAAARARRGE